MELVVTLRKKELLDKIAPLIDGVIVGKFFSCGYRYSFDDLIEISDYCKNHNLKYYVAIDDFIEEDELYLLDKYLDFLKGIDFDGIYFHDFGVYELAKKYNFVSKLIYDGKTISCNSADSLFLLRKGIDSIVIARELTYEEVCGIAKNLFNQIDMQIFGHTRLSYSKRKFLKNYFKEINKEYDYLNKETLTLIEQQRDYSLPIIENERGTYIYSDYVFEMLDEINSIQGYLKRGIIETLFVDDNVVLQICREYRRVSKENKEFLKHNLLKNYPENYSSGFLYQKTNITKDE